MLGRRGNPASYPDRDPETTLFPDGWVANKDTKWRAPATPQTTPVYFQLQEPKLDDKTLFQNYAVWALGLPCSTCVDAVLAGRLA